MDKLTKDYILKFGWKYINRFYYEYPIKNTIYIEEYSNRPVDFRLNFVEYDRYLMLEAYERNGFEWEVCFRGRCRTEDEFDNIMKLFNINKISAEKK